MIYGRDFLCKQIRKFMKIKLVIVFDRLSKLKNLDL